MNLCKHSTAWPRCIECHHSVPDLLRHHSKCAARDGYGLCNRPAPCVKIQEAIDAFNADDSKTHRSNPDSREHYYARWPILAEDCDYEISGFSGVRGMRL